MADSPNGRLAALETLDSAALRQRWSEVYETAPPPHASRDLLLRATAYRMQERAEGGLSKAALKRLAKLADPHGQHARTAAPPVPRLRPGTRLVREWRGEVHQVTVLEERFEYRGERYTSLSRIAREITGTRWSGPLFFGLRKAGTRSEDPADGT